MLAILLENFVTTQQSEEARQTKIYLEMLAALNKNTGGIDPVLNEMFLQFKTSHAMDTGITEVCERRQECFRGC